MQLRKKNVFWITLFGSLKPFYPAFCVVLMTFYVVLVKAIFIYKKREREIKLQKSEKNNVIAEYKRCNQKSFCYYCQRKCIVTQYNWRAFTVLYLEGNERFRQTFPPAHSRGGRLIYTFICLLGQCKSAIIK